MLDKFNFYDLLGYLLPGATVVLTIYSICRWGFGIQVPDVSTDFGSSVFFLGLSYLVGQLIHGVGSEFEDRLMKLHGGHRTSERLLLRMDDTFALDDKQGFSPELRARILAAATAVFKVADRPREIFEQCYALVVQQGFAQHTEIFLAFGGLARTMLVAGAIGLLAGMALVSKQLVMKTAVLFGFSLPVGATWSLSWQQLVLGEVIFAAFILVEVIMYRAFVHFRLIFARSVYYNFLAWYGRDRLSASAPAQR